MAKKNKELESKIKVKRAINNISGLIVRYEDKEKEIIALAAQAKKDGRTNDYHSAVATLKVYIARKEKTKSMLHRLRLSEIVRDDAEMTGEYLGAMQTLAEETSKMFKSGELKKLARSFKRSGAAAEKNRAVMDGFLDEVEDVYRQMTDLDDEYAPDAELQSRIDAQIDGIGRRIDEEISKRG